MTNSEFNFPNLATRLSQSIQRLDNQIAVRNLIEASPSDRVATAREQSIADYRPSAKMEALLDVVNASSYTNSSRVRSDDTADEKFQVGDIIFEMLGGDDS